MTFDAKGYVLTPDDGQHMWFLDTRMTVKAGTEQTGGGLTVIEWRAPAGFGPPLHIHDGEDEAFYLLAGEMIVDCGGQRWTAGPGDFVFLPRSIPHSFVVTEGDAHGLQLTTPSGFERFVAGVGRPAEGPGLPIPTEPDVERLAEAGLRYGSRIIGPPLSP